MCVPGCTHLQHCLGKLLLAVVARQVDVILLLCTHLERKKTKRRADKEAGQAMRSCVVLTINTSTCRLFHFISERPF